VIYLDSGVLIRAVLKHHPAYKACSILIHRDAVSSTHSLAEAFNTLTSHFQVANSDAALALASLRDRMELEPILLRITCACSGTPEGAVFRVDLSTMLYTLMLPED